MRRTSWPFARALASAFLAGAWEPEGMRSRALDLMGNQKRRRPRWLTALIGEVLQRFPEAPHDARDTLARMLLGTEHLSRAPGLTLRHPVVDAPAMRAPRWNVVPIDTLAELERWLQLDPSTLGWLADRRGLEHHARASRLMNYRYAWVPKRSGGSRLLEAPKARLKAIQRKILSEVLTPISPHGAAHGFCPGRSVLTHARQHVGKAVVIRFDLRSFFADIKTPRAYGVFRAAGYPEEVARSLIALCTNQVPRSILAAAPPPSDGAEAESLWHLRKRLSAWHLPQGAPTSPALANLCARALDVRLTAFANRLGLTYSRYADDLAFSGDASFGTALPRFTRWVEAIVRDEGFSLHPLKSRLMKRSGRQALTGVVVNERLNVPRERHDRIKATLHRCKLHGVAQALKPTETVEALQARLRGEISWVEAVNPARGARLLEAFETIVW